MKLSDFDVLSFDCYGTLIDWESGIYTALAPLRTRAGVSQADGEASPAGMKPSRGVALSRDAVWEAFGRLEAGQQRKTPDMVYSDLLAEVHGQLAAEWGVARDPAEDAAFGRSVEQWPPFPDSVEALRYLKQHFRLVILSNVDRISFRATNQRL
ncbi:MAG: 2-haloacid dehalogenase, partial [Acetobacteraceae bacterium]|nr:2-haloacid dehalogenase [Acetobacteraceae bacterium]